MTKPELNIEEDFLKELENLFSPGDPEEETEDPFDDDLPEPDSPLYKVMSGNGILHAVERKIYSEYNTANIGCSKANPIVITEIDDYVGLEYDLLEYILRPSPYRFVDYRRTEQRLILEDGRAIDKITVEVSKHPHLSFEEFSPGAVPPREVLGTEDYYFDVTTGYNALYKYLSK